MGSYKDCQDSHVLTRSCNIQQDWLKLIKSYNCNLTLFKGQVKDQNLILSVWLSLSVAEYFCDIFDKSVESYSTLQMFFG